MGGELTKLLQAPAGRADCFSSVPHTHTRNSAVKVPSCFPQRSFSYTICLRSSKQRLPCVLERLSGWKPLVRGCKQSS